MPQPGMILQARNDLAMILSRSILISKNGTDIQAGNAAGLGTRVPGLVKPISIIFQSSYTITSALMKTILYAY